MKITMSDHRNEERNSKTILINGEPYQSRPSADGGYYALDYDYEKVAETRSLAVTIEHKTDADVPEVLPDITDRNIDHFFVDLVAFQWTRTLNQGWEMSRIIVSGINCRKDGSRGAKTGSTRYPTYHKEQRGVIDESDYAWAKNHPTWKDKGGIPDYAKEHFGKPRMVDIADPLPAWLEKIVAEHHPVTGTIPFIYGDTHLFGEFASERHTDQVEA